MGGMLSVVQLLIYVVSMGDDSAYSVQRPSLGSIWVVYRYDMVRHRNMCVVYQQ